MRSRKSTQIRLHLFCNLFLAYALFMGGIDQTSYIAVCNVITASLHFFFLTSFLWMSVYSHSIYKSVIRVSFRINFFVTFLFTYTYFYSSSEGYPLQVRHKQDWGRGFILLLLQTAALPESDAGSGVIKLASSFVIQNRQNSCSMWWPMYGARCYYMICGLLRGATLAIR